MQRITLTILMLLTLPLGCAKPKGIVFEPLEQPLRWPAPPDIARIEYVGKIVSNTDLKPAKSFGKALGETLFGKEPSRSMLSPYALCVDEQQRLFVCDSNAQVVHVFYLNTREYEQWKPIDPDNGFSQPTGVAINALGHLLVTDPVARAIFTFDTAGNYISKFGSEHLARPTSLAIDQQTNRIFVADTAAHQIVVFSADGKLMQRMGTRGSELGQFNFPTNIAFDSKGNLYVSDTLNFRVQVFDRQLKPIRQIGSKGDLPGYFSHPKGIALDSEDHLYVIDSHFESIQIFDSQGALLMAFGEEGHGPGQFWLPTGIWIDTDNRIWVADSYNRRVQVFDYLPKVQR